MQPLNIANIIADLNDLNVADPVPALHLVTANKTLGQVRRRSKPSYIVRTSTQSYFPTTTTATHGRRGTQTKGSIESGLLTPGGALLSPSIARRSGAARVVGGLRRGDSDALAMTPPSGSEAVAAEPAMDPDMLRARMLVELYEMRQTGRQSELKELEKTKSRVLDIEGEYRNILKSLKS